MSRASTFTQLAAASNHEWARDVQTIAAPGESQSLADAFAGLAADAALIGAHCISALEPLDTASLPSEDRKRLVSALLEIASAGAQAHALACRARFVAEGQRVNATDRAIEIVRASLPRDGRWHPCALILQAVEQAGGSRRTGQRAAKRLGIEHRRAAVEHAPSLWRWKTQSLVTAGSDTVSRKHTAKRPHAPTPPHTSAIATTVTV